MTQRFLIGFFLAVLSSVAYAQAVDTDTNSHLTLSIIGQDSFELTSPAEPILSSFSVRLVDTSDRAVPGATISFFDNGTSCFSGAPGCVIPPLQLYGHFAASVVNVITDQDGKATFAGFIGGTYPGTYTIAAMMQFSASMVNQQLLGGHDLTVLYSVDQEFTVQPFVIGPAITGSWYDPLQSGQGLNIEVLSDNQIVVFFYTFDSAGNNIFLSGVGQIDGATAMVPLNSTRGGFFPPNFDAAKISRDAWGTLQITFSDCNNGIAQWSPTADGFTVGALDISRITSVQGLTCDDG